MMNEIVDGHRFVMVTQKKEWGEILLSFEAKNRYQLSDSKGTLLGFAAEQSTGFVATVARQLLGQCRASKVHIWNHRNKEVAVVHKKFSLYFHEATLMEGDQKVGRVQRNFSILNRKFTVEDSAGREVFEILSPMFRIYTFKVLRNGEEVARISKKWGGVFKEVFSDADKFGVEFMADDITVENKKLLVAATFLIDFTCFENNN